MIPELRKLPVEDRLIIRELFSRSVDVALYELHEKFRLSPAQISRAVRHLKSFGLIEERDDHIYLVPEGRIWILRHRIALFCSNTKGYWKRTADYSSRPHYELDTPYMPEKKSVSRRFFERLL